MSKVWMRLRPASRGDEGATAVEYGILVALIAVAIIGAVGALGQNLAATLTKVAGMLP